MGLQGKIRVGGSGPTLWLLGSCAGDPQKAGGDGVFHILASQFCLWSLQRQSLGSDNTVWPPGANLLPGLVSMFGDLCQ